MGFEWFEGIFAPFSKHFRNLVDFDGSEARSSLKGRA